MKDELTVPDDREIKSQALRYLARRDYGVHEIRQKLLSKFPNSVLVDKIIQKLVAEKLLNEARFIENFIEFRARKGFGPNRILFELSQKQVDTVGFDCVRSLEKQDWSEIIYRVWLKKYGNFDSNDLTEKARQYQFLAYRGFTTDQIRHLFKQLEHEEAKA